MATVKRKTSYLYGGKEYNTLTEIRAHIENQIGSKIIDKAGAIPPKQAMTLLKAMIDNRRLLTSLLSVTVSDEEDRETSIFDIIE